MNSNACPTTGQQKRGVTTVEFALTAPILFLLVFGGIELSRANMLMHTADIAVMAAARQGIVPGATNAECVAAAQAELEIAGITSFNLEINPTAMNDGTTQVVANLTVPVNGKNGYFLPQFFVGRSVFKTVTLQREGKHESVENETAQTASDPEGAHDDGGSTYYINNPGPGNNGNGYSQGNGNNGNGYGQGNGNNGNGYGQGNGNNGNGYGYGQGNGNNGNGNGPGNGNGNGNGYGLGNGNGNGNGYGLGNGNGP